MWKSTKWKYKNEILYVHYAVFFIFYAVFLAVTAWRYADDAGEHSREVVVVVKADFVAYLGLGATSVKSVATLLRPKD